MKSIRCIVGIHAQRKLWGVTPSPTEKDFPKYIWECVRCGGFSFSGSPKSSKAPVRKATQ